MLASQPTPASSPRSAPAARAQTASAASPRCVIMRLHASVSACYCADTQRPGTSHMSGCSAQLLMLPRLAQGGDEMPCHPPFFICSALGTPVVPASQPTPASSPRHAPAARAQTASVASLRCAGILRQAHAGDGDVSRCFAFACCQSCIDKRGDTSCHNCLILNLQCSSYTCGAGFTADTSTQSTVCPGGTCTDSFCCQPQVRRHLAACTCW